MKIGIVDDDINFSHKLKKLITNTDFFSVSDICVFNNSFTKLDLEDYDYLFIDILLDKDDGIALAASINNKATKIIFISTDGLLIYNCLDTNFYFFIRKDKYEDDFKRLLGKIEKDEVEANRLYLIDGRTNLYLKYIDICYVQSNRNLCTFYTLDNKYQQYITLKKCKEVLCKNIAFYKINSYTIINFKYVVRINNQHVTLANNETFNVSRKAKDIIEKYMRYCRYMS